MPNLNTESFPRNLFSVPDISSETTVGQDVFIYSYHSPSVARELIVTAQMLVNPRGKGIYATDEAPDAIEATFDAAMGNDRKGISEAEEKAWTAVDRRERRRRWREFAYRTVPADCISGIILHSEALLEFKLGPALSLRGIIPGIRANGELVPIPSSPAEFRVQGLDDLLAKLQFARASGARFSKWRVPVACTSASFALPTDLSLEIQADTLAQFAAISQQAGLVPIVEPDVDFSRNADLARSAEVHEKIITMTYEKMRKYGVLLEGSLIKPSFPQPGLSNHTRERISADEIALATATVISRSVPTAVPGVLFLSGGLPSDTATKFLAAVNRLMNAAAPGSTFARLPILTFSYGRAIQDEALKLWIRGDDTTAKEAFEKWTRACSDAAKGVA